MFFAFTAVAADTAGDMPFSRDDLSDMIFGDGIADFHDLSAVFMSDRCTRNDRFL